MVLDVGCGIGRVVLVLIEFLLDEGKYEGFDVVKKGIVWCENGIVKDFLNFNFKYIFLNNDLYYFIEDKVENFVFLYENNFFDIIFLFLVFIYM